MLRVDVLDALGIGPRVSASGFSGAEAHPPTFNPLSALLPLEKMLSFMNKSSCR